MMMSSSLLPEASVTAHTKSEGRSRSHLQTLVTENVVVALNAGKEITKHALGWALSNVVQAGDHITLVALLHGRNGRKLWSLPRLGGDCANRSNKGGKNANPREKEEDVTDSCSLMMQQLHKLCDSKQVKVSVRVVPAAAKGTTAMEAQRVKATWVVLDSQLRKEESKHCLEQLQCNLVVVKRLDAKVLRLNLKACVDPEKSIVEGLAPSTSTSKTSIAANLSSQEAFNNREALSNLISSIHRKQTYTIFEEATSSGSPGGRTPFTATDKGTSSASSSESSTSPLTRNEALKACTSQRVNDMLIVETDSASDYEFGDVPSDAYSSSDDSYQVVMGRRPVSRTANASPEHRCKGSSFRMSGRWLDYSLSAAAKRESYSVDPWMPTAKIRPNSTNATPRAHAKHRGKVFTTPTSPSSSSKRLSGNSRLSLSMREGGSGLHEGSPSSEGQKSAGQAYQRHLRSVQSLNSNSKSRTRRFELDKGNWVKRVLTTKELVERFAAWDPDSVLESEIGNGGLSKCGDFERTSSVRRAMSLSRHVPPGPPPLCSICQHKAPVFGKPPRRFAYAELELATGGFSQANFLAEGGFGSVHRGVLPDGQAVAVKQHKLASSQGDIEFCSEVEVLSCAQHRNVVMLIGYCIEDKRRLLVYEFICNGSLDAHLYGRDKGALEWVSRQKVAVGAARGLRYLHEECRVGCIVHRDMRPNNILLTHDYEPMVGDFGLARWQPDGDLGVQTRVIGTFGYLAPEYAQSGQITEKADVYSFGVVLLELATGRKAVDLNRPKGQQCLTEWWQAVFFTSLPNEARPLLDDHAIQDLLDPLLEGCYSDYEAYCMLHAASLCIRKDPHLRPRMSQVLRILEGDIVIDKSGTSTPRYGNKLTYNTSVYGSQNHRILSDYVASRVASRSPHPLTDSGKKLSTVFKDSPMCHAENKLSYDALRAAYKDRGNSRKLSYTDDM
ncbi:hypothetical protein L7F22_038304 [Adiantum nelumboides]|nr:hypothetical protein [Adiantum nelumboides]